MTALGRELRLFDAVVLFVGVILGSGVFFAPAAVAGAAPGLVAALLLWLVGALISAAGALTYAECGARLPEDGGFYVFYRTALGEGWAFVGAWSAVLVTYPASIAAMALFSGSNAARVFPGGASPVALAMLGVGAATLLNIAGLHSGAWTQRFFTSAKVLAVLALCGIAVFGGTHVDSAVPGLTFAPAGSAILGAMVAILWTYSGWSDLTLLSGEIRDPQRNLVRAVLIGCGVLFVVFSASQVAVWSVLPADVAAQSPSVIPAALDAVLGPELGPTAGRLMAGLIALSVFGAYTAASLAVSRLVWAMADGGLLPRRIGHVSRRLGTPAYASLAVAATSLAYLAGGSLLASPSAGDESAAVGALFSSLLGVFTFSVWLFYALAAVALLRLRRRGVGGTLPFTSAVTTLAPYVIIVAGLGMTLWLLTDPEQRRLAAVGALLLAAGFPAHWLFRRFAAVAKPPGP